MPEDEIAFPANMSITCAVGAMTQGGEKANFSCYGPELSFVAPGVEIWSTVKGTTYYDELGGTSMASPMAAGVGALIHSVASQKGWVIPEADCMEIMNRTARDIYPSGWDEETGWGCVDAREALRLFYWPYPGAKKTGVSSNSVSTKVESNVQVVFNGKPNDNLPAGTYWVDKYRVEVTATFSNPYESGTRPWAWGRRLEGSPGYSPTNPTDARPWIKTVNETYNQAKFETYVYWIKYNAIGQVINEWAPMPPDDVAISYIAYGVDEVKTIHSPPGIPSSQYGLDSDLAVDFVHPDVPNAVHISYLDRENEDLRYIIDNFNGFTNSEVVDSDGSVGWFSSIALDPDGYPHISYHDATHKLAKHAWKDASGWHNEPLWTDVPEFGGLHTSIAVSHTGLIQACFFVTDFHEAIPEPCNGKDLVWVYRNGVPPFNWVGGAVDVEGDVGRWCSLAVGPDGTPHISYYDATNTSLKYAVRVGTDDWSATTVDNSGNVGEHTSIAVDKLDGVHISYYDYTNDALKYAYKAQGGSSWQIETVDPNYGEGTSICIDDDGRPVIVYGGYHADIRCRKKTTSGWVGYPIDWNGYANYGTSVGIDNLGRMVATYYKDDKLYVARRMRWPQESGYGSMMAGNNAGVSEELRPSIPMEPEITAVIPNPTTGAATIRFHIPRTTNVDVAVYDVTGREVTSLFSGEQSAGEHELLWEGRDNSGRQVPSGVYFIRMEAGNHQSRKKLTLLR